MGYLVDAVLQVVKAVSDMAKLVPIAAHALEAVLKLVEIAAPRLRRDTGGAAIFSAAAVTDAVMMMVVMPSVDLSHAACEEQSSAPPEKEAICSQTVPRDAQNRARDGTDRSLAARL